MRRGGLALAAVSMTLAPATGAAKPAARPDWTRTFAATPEGGFRMGNPKAKVAIVEYASLTCPHCRHFAEDAVKPLIQQYVRTGKASYEYRSYVLNGMDLAATMVARCGGPSRFFPIAEQLYATQPSWAGKVDALPKAEQDKLQGMSTPDLMVAVARVTGLFPVAAAHGIPPAKAQACLRDEAAGTKLMEMVQAGSDKGVTGTPTFFVNGKKVPAYDWATLQPFLKDAGG